MTGPVTDPRLAAEAKSLDQLARDLAAIPREALATTEEKDKIRRDLMAVVETPTPPESGRVKQLASDLTDAIAHRTRDAFEAQSLAAALKLVLNHQAAAAIDVRTAIQRSASLLKAGGIKADDLKSVSTDLDGLAAAKPAAP